MYIGLDFSVIVLEMKEYYKISVIYRCKNFYWQAVTFSVGVLHEAL
jgi:hypothetical protein